MSERAAAEQWAAPPPARLAAGGVALPLLFSLPCAVLPSLLDPMSNLH
jgi:hypothetical protein